MSLVLKGAPVAAVLNLKTAQIVEKLAVNGGKVTLATVRIGERPDDLSYQRSLIKKADGLGIEVRQIVLKEDCSQKELMEQIDKLNRDEGIHGILMFRPLPVQFDEQQAIEAIDPRKDVDGCGSASLAGLLKGSGDAFVPCTAQAVMEMLHHYEIPVSGKNAVVAGRSLVIGKPVSLLLLNENATVTVCHSKTDDLAAVTRNADIVVTAIGKAEFFGREYFRSNQTVIDVGMNFSQEKGKMCGDVRYEEVEPVVSAITPVPAGVGVVTTAVLMLHVALAAEKAGI